MNLLIRAIILTGVILGFSYGSSWGTPTIPDNAVMTDQQVGQCESGVILRYMYDLPDGGNVVIFKRPNSEEIVIYLRWNPGNQNEADEVWANGVQMTIQELRSKHPAPCDVFESVKA